MAIKKKKKAGRPTLPEGAARTERLVVKCTPAEIAMVDTLASRYGIDRSKLLRKALFIVAMDPGAFGIKSKSVRCV